MFKILSCFAAILGTVDVYAQTEHEWPQFLGPNRNGISNETGLLDVWPENGPKVVWRTTGGVGMSGLAVSRGRMLTMIQTDGKQHVVCLDAKTGKTIWQTSVAPEYKNGQGKGPRATPTIAGNAVFAFTGEGILVALRFADGRVVWSHNAVTDHGGKPADYGMSCSPLIVGNYVIVTVGAPKATVLAYDKITGKLAWKAGADDATGYSSPALLNVGGRQQIVVFTGSSVLGLAPANGKVYWRYPYKTAFDCNIATPLAHKGHVFISSGENHGSVMLKLTSDGSRFSASEVWSSQGVKSVLRNEWQTSMLIDGYLYGFDNVGSAGPVTHLTCVNAATGERAWQKLRFGKGNLIAADGKLLISTMKGEFILVAASPIAYKEIGRATVIGTARQAPALSAGLVYLRADREIVCLDVRKN
jgi:outer membrane protein assembly factor BamB